MGLFERYANYYDIYYQHKDYGTEAAKVHELLTNRKKGVRNILEFGCGTGRHAIELAKLGYSVCGIDLSSIMIDCANSNIPHSLREQLSFRQGDARFFQFDEQYDAVIALFHVMSYQVTNEDVQNVVLNATTHLKDGGLLIFDFWYGPAVLTLLPQERVHRHHFEHLEVSRTARPSVDTRNNLVEVEYTIHANDLLTGEKECTIETHQMRYFSIPEICHFLKIGNFTLLSDSESFTDQTLSPSTWSATVCAMKQSSQKA